MARLNAIGKRLEGYYSKPSERQRLYSIFNLTFSCVSVILYVRATINELSSALEPVDQALSVWFIVVFVWEFARAHDRLWHARRWMTWFDFMSLLPIIRYVVVGAQKLRAFRAFRILRVHRVLVFFPPGSKRRIVEASLIILSVLFLLTAVVYEFGQVGLVKSKFSDENITFLEAFYFVVVTFTTVGYGDIYPAETLSRAVVGVAIPPMIVLVPVLVNRVFSEIGTWSSYAKAVGIAASRQHVVERLFRRHNGREREDVWHHVVVAGNVVGDGDNSLGRQLPVMLEHCFLSDDDRLATRYLQLVILSSDDPPPSFEKTVLEHPYYQTRVGWVTGSAYESKHVMEWARARSALAIVVVGDASAKRAELQKEDDRTVRQAVAIKRQLEKEESEMPVVAALFHERNFYRLEDEARTGCVVVCLDELKFALLARSLVVPDLHSLLTNLVCKKPLVRLEIDEAKMAAFGGNDPAARGRQSHAHSSRFSTRDSTDKHLPALRGALSSQALLVAHHTRNRPSRDEVKTLDDIEEQEPQALDSVVTDEGQDEWVQYRLEAERLERDLATSMRVHELEVEDRMVGVRFEALAVAAHSAVQDARDNYKHLTRLDDRLRRHDDHHSHELIMGALPVAVVSRPLEGDEVPAAAWSRHYSAESVAPLSSDEPSAADQPYVAATADSFAALDDQPKGSRVTVNFPVGYCLSKGDAVLMIARKRRDAEAIMSVVDFEGLKAAPPLRPTTMVAHESLDGQLRVAMQSINNVGHKPAKIRTQYMDEWIRTHVVCEVPDDLENHVVFCGGVDQAPYFLQPLMFGSASCKSDYAPPTVVVVDHIFYPDEVEVECDPDTGVPVVSRNYRILLESCIFYDPLNETDDDSPTVRRPRLYILLGNPLERPRRYRCSGFPSALERAGAHRAAHFVLPKEASREDPSSDTDDERDDVFLDDDFNIKVARNLQLLIPRGSRARIPHILAEVVDPKRAREFFDLHRDDDLELLGPYGQGTSAACGGHRRIEMFSDRLLQSAAIVAAVDATSILMFVKHAVCAWRRDGSHPAFVLQDGSRYESCAVCVVRIQSMFVGKEYVTLLEHMVNDKRALPIALYRRSYHLAPPSMDNSSSNHADSNDQKRRRGSFSSQVYDTLFKADASESTHSLAHPSVASTRHHHHPSRKCQDPYYVYTNPLPREIIHEGDQLFVLANSSSRLNGRH